MGALDLDYLFHPQSIAIAGVKDVNVKFNPGLMFLEALMKFGYKGRLYPLNPAGGEVLGLKVYKNVKKYRTRLITSFQPSLPGIRRNW